MDGDTSDSILWSTETIFLRHGKRVDFHNGLGARVWSHRNRDRSGIDIPGFLCGLRDNGFLSGVMDL
jgi:hypothetical protein